MQKIRYALVLWLYILASTSLLAYDNPAARYCTVMGYTYTIVQEADGETGYCTFPDKSRVNAWAFFYGTEAKTFSYCEQNGYDMVTDQISKNSYITKVPVCESKLKQAPIERFNMVELMQEKSNISLQRSKKKAPADTKTFTAPTLRSTLKTYADSLDWRSYNGKAYIGDVRDQGSCGDCYAFGAAAAAEGAYNYENNLTDAATIDFSESYIAWCLGTYGSYSAHFDGCDGADYDYAELTALTNEGVTLESYFPYTESDPGSCTHGSDPVTVFKSWGRIAVNDTAAIQGALSTYGVLDVAVDVTTDFENYSGGIFSDTQTDCPDGAYTTTNHAVSLVGWGTDATEGLYWILRNSWGSSWGESGYMRIKAQAARVACAATYIEANNIDPAYCSYSISPSTQSYTSSSADGTITVQSAPDGCTIGSWSATESLSWVTLTGTTSGSGSGVWSVGYHVDANTQGSRSGTITIDGRTHTISQDGELDVVIDGTTGLWWQDQPYTQAEADAYDDNTETGKMRYWEGAKTYCQGLELAGYTDWYLPSQTELLSIVDTNYDPTIKSVFQNAVSSSYWSATEYDASNAIKVHFSYGSASYTPKDYSYYVRCVRQPSSSQSAMNPSIIMYLLN